MSRRGYLPPRQRIGDTLLPRRWNARGARSIPRRSHGTALRTSCGHCAERRHIHDRLDGRASGSRPARLAGMN
eukprot:6285900-Pyramimonas_sp.AAC.1